MKIAVIGGDARMLYAAKEFAKQKIDCFLYGVEDQSKNSCRDFPFGRCYAPYRLEDATNRVDAVLLPIPLTKDGKTLNAPFFEGSLFLKDLAKQIPVGALIFGGGLKKEYFLKEQEPFLVDLLQNEKYLKRNALPTAESALGLALLHRNTVLRKEDCAVFGYGNIGKELSALLQNMGAKLTVYERKEEKRKLLEQQGVRALPFFETEKNISKHKVLFNTVPFEIFTKEALLQLSEDALYIELASKPYGFPEKMRSILPCSYLPAFGLPGKYMPKYAGEQIAESVFNELQRRK